MSKIVLVYAKGLTKLCASSFLEKISWCMQEGDTNFSNCFLSKGFSKYLAFNNLLFAAHVHNFSEKRPNFLVEKEFVALKFIKVEFSI